MLRGGELLSKSFIDFPMAAELWEASHTYFHNETKTQGMSDLTFSEYISDFKGCIMLMPMEIPCI